VFRIKYSVDVTPDACLTISHFDDTMMPFNGQLWNNHNNDALFNIAKCFPFNTTTTLAIQDGIPISRGRSNRRKQRHRSSHWYAILAQLSMQFNDQCT
jgi:hypothetical protein